MGAALAVAASLGVVPVGVEVGQVPGAARRSALVYLQIRIIDRCQGVLLAGSVAWAKPAMIAHSDRRCGETGSFIPCEMCTIDTSSCHGEASRSARYSSTPCGTVSIWALFVTIRSR